jgi:predicted GIY-YIG superfamily endonuclease
VTAEPIDVGATPTAVYRFYNASHVLLYVGITENLGTRWKSHAKLKPWWPEVAERALVWHPNREAAATEESMAILNEGPLYNVIGKPRKEGPRDWRPWEATRTRKQRALRVTDEDWADYSAVCEHEDVMRDAYINAFIRRRIKAFRRKNPEVPLPSDKRSES